MEKQVNNSIKDNAFLKLFGVILMFALLSGSATAQDVIFDKGKTYTLAGIEVTGLKSYNEQTVITYTGLRVGQQITIPGEEISAIINKLWKLSLFSNVSFYITRIEGDKIFLELNIEELPVVSEVKILGIKESKAETLMEETDLKKGKKITESFVTNTRNYIINKYKKQGYLNTKVAISTVPDTTESNALKMTVKIDRDERVKVKDIAFEGNEKLSDKKLRKALKNTKEKNLIRFWKKSKYIEADFEEDLVSLIDKYKESGYRDARIISDTIVKNEDNTIDINIALEEGDKYYFGDITFLGNTVYSDRELSRVLGIKRGDTYNGVLLKKRIQDASNPDADDLTNLYQNNGYLFSSINPVEVSAENDTIDFEIRVIEGKPAYFNNITVSGNERTNDHVIFREIRTRPGQLYSKEKIVRTIRELGQLGYFDPEQIVPDLRNVDPNSGTLDVQYGLVEKGSSQIELQGGYGGGGFIGTLGLSFNNFAIKDLFNKDAYKPVPMGDGQRLSLRLQASRFFQTYSFSFAEPWLGGRQPVQFSSSISRSLQFRFDPLTRDVARDQRILITGITFGLAKKLKVPDDFFILSQSLSYQHYDIRNYNIGIFPFANGRSNSVAYTIALTRNNTYTNPVFPLGGSEFSISAKLTPPFSLLNGIDYSDLENREEYQIKDAQGRLLDNNGDLVSDSGNAPAVNEDKVAQERLKWLEFYKIKVRGTWYSRIIDKLVMKTHAEFGFLGAYDNDRGLVPFERFFVGGDGLGNFTLDGRENIALRGYPNQSLSPGAGSVIYNKFSLELRYPLTLKPAASIYALTFLEAGGTYNNFRDYNPFLLKRSAGVGLRIFMPAFGLLGIDFGYGFDSLQNSNQRNGWETHFIIGQQF